MKEAREQHEAEMRRFAEPQPFTFATEKRSEERRPILFKLHIKVDGKGKVCPPVHAREIRLLPWTCCLESAAVGHCLIMMSVRGCVHWP